MKKYRKKCMGLLLGTIFLFSSCGKINVEHPVANGNLGDTSEHISEADNFEAYPYFFEPSGGTSYSLISEEYMYYIGLFNAEEYDNKVAARVRRINLKTGEESSPCPDPLCMHDTLECPCFGAQSMTPLRMFGDWLCIQSTFVGSFKRLVLNTQSSEPYTRRILLNLKTGEWFSAWENQSKAFTNSYELFSDGDHLYITTYGSSITDSMTGEVYQPTVIRSINLKTREEKEVYSHKYYISIGMVTQQRIYFYESLGDECYTFYSIDLSGEDFRKEPNLSVAPDIVYKNYIYGVSGNGVEPYILINNTETGEIINTGILSVSKEMDVYGEYLYYIDRGKGYESRWIEGQSSYTSENLRDPVIEEEYKRFNEEMNSYPCYLWRCRLDGSNPEMILNLGAVNTRYLRIIGNDCYIQDVFYDSETNRWYWGDHQYYEEIYVQRRICRINLQTGEKEPLGTEWVG